MIVFDTGSTRSYPFDSYTSHLEVWCHEMENITNRIPVQYTMLGAVPGYSLLGKSTLIAKTMELEFEFYRSNTTRGFSLFVFCLSWILSVFVGLMAVQVAYSERPVDAPMIASSCALLYALPSLV